jgi:cytochrome c55X
VRAAIVLMLAQAACVTAAAGQTAAPDAKRQAELVRMVRQDCGSCHGMRLTGGLGPALTPQALADRPREGLVATVVQGRPGTPMPGWRALLDEADAEWIVAQLLRGFPEEPRAGR